MHAVLSVKLETGAFPIIVWAISLVTLGILATRRPLKRWLPLQLAGAAVGVGVGYLLAFLLSDVWNTFDVALDAVTRAWFGAGIGAIGFCVAGLTKGARWRRVLSATSIPLFALALAVGVNADVAEFPTLASALGVSQISALSVPTKHTHPSGHVGSDVSVSPTADATTADTPAMDHLSRWRSTTTLPAHGTVGTVTIPATISHFRARQAIVYLPPAALVKDAPRLPVLEMLSGQPGGPSNLITSGDMATILDEYAAAHHGLAPIVVIPDQLGAPQLNPMCLDSPLGNSATYITVDVPNWIRAHLHVALDRDDWAIGGFSEGGTCSAQLGAADSSIYGNIFDISGQTAPFRTSRAYTIDAAFGGSAAKYAAAAPAAIMAAHGAYLDTLGVFVVGQNDTRYGVDSVVVSNAARAAGMDVRFVKSPGTAHDWHTVQFAIRTAIPILGARWGLQ